ncbi:MAG: hypothetical protein AABM40_14465 [Chloroflexota bacterium]
MHACRENSAEDRYKDQKDHEQRHSHQQHVLEGDGAPGLNVLDWLRVAEKLPIEVSQLRRQRAVRVLLQLLLSQSCRLLIETGRGKG